MSRRRRAGVGVLLCVAVALFGLATFFGQGVMAMAMGAACALALVWAYILVSERKGGP